MAERLSRLQEAFSSRMEMDGSCDFCGNSLAEKPRRTVVS